MIRRQLLGLFAAAALPALAQMMMQEPAMKGYDPVAYFTANQAMQGQSAFTAEHEGRTYHFASEENRAMFRKEPAKYMPQFGGYCAWAVSQNYLYPGDPTAFTVRDGRLFLNANQDVSKKFNAEIGKLVPMADKNWPGLKGKAMEKDNAMKKGMK
jgi:YHS domain-containing protein